MWAPANPQLAVCSQCSLVGSSEGGVGGPLVNFHQDPQRGAGQLRLQPETENDSSQQTEDGRRGYRPFWPHSTALPSSEGSGTPSPSPPHHPPPLLPTHTTSPLHCSTASLSHCPPSLHTAHCSEADKPLRHVTLPSDHVSSRQQHTICETKFNTRLDQEEVITLHTGQGTGSPHPPLQISNGLESVRSGKVR